MSDLGFFHSSLIDGRQSERALSIQRGVGRLLNKMGYAHLSEFVLPSGRRADIMAVGQKGEILIIEVKSSREDYATDQKWHEYLNHSDQFAFATLPDVDPNIFPTDQGLMIADEYGAELVREFHSFKLSAPTRKALTLSFARESAMRLARLADAGLREKSVD